MKKKTKQFSWRLATMMYTNKTNKKHPHNRECFLVAGGGLEPPTSRLWAWRAAIALPRGKRIQRVYDNISPYNFVNAVLVAGAGIEPAT